VEPLYAIVVAKDNKTYGRRRIVTVMLLHG
jgi:hypothetical protein